MRWNRRPIRKIPPRVLTAAEKGQYKEDVGEIIAVRGLEYVEQGKQNSFVEVAIVKLRRFPDSTDYYAPYRKKGAGIEKERYARGVDAAQAL